ncbi:MAG: hypothetical protein DI618_08360, partial [Dermacoccus nishinomiyaensis]
MQEARDETDTQDGTGPPRAVSDIAGEHRDGQGGGGAHEHRRGTARARQIDEAWPPTSEPTPEYHEDERDQRHRREGRRADRGGRNSSGARAGG